MRYGHFLLLCFETYMTFIFIDSGQEDVGIFISCIWTGLHCGIQGFILTCYAISNIVVLVEWMNRQSYCGILLSLYLSLIHESFVYLWTSLLFACRFTHTTGSTPAQQTRAWAQNALLPAFFLPPVRRPFIFIVKRHDVSSLTLDILAVDGTITPFICLHLWRG